MPWTGRHGQGGSRGRAPPPRQPPPRRRDGRKWCGRHCGRGRGEEGEGSWGPRRSSPAGGRGVPSTRGVPSGAATSALRAQPSPAGPARQEDRPPGLARRRRRRGWQRRSVPPGGRWGGGAGGWLAVAPSRPATAVRIHPKPPPLPGSGGAAPPTALCPLRASAPHGRGIRRPSLSPLPLPMRGRGRRGGRRWSGLGFTGRSRVERAGGGRAHRTGLGRRAALYGRTGRGAGPPARGWQLPPPPPQPTECRRWG